MEKLLKLVIGFSVMLSLLCCTSKDKSGVSSGFQFPEKVEVKEVGTVGQQNEELFFAQPKMVTPVPENRFIVTDSQTKRLYYFDENFELIEFAGQEGRGPTDFLRINNILSEDSTIRVVDARNTRITTFIAGNHEIDQVATEAFDYVMLPEHPAASFMELIPFSEGYLSVYADFNIVSKEEVKMTRIVGIPYTQSLIQDTSAAPFVLDYKPEMYIDRTILSIPYARRGYYTAIRNNLVYAVNDVPEIQLLNKWGEVENTIELPDTREELTQMDKEEAYNHQYRNSPDPAKYRTEVMEQIPNKRPVVQNLKSDSNNRIWVQIFTNNKQTNGSWLIFDKDGTGVAMLKLPEGNTFRNAKDQRVYTQRETGGGPEIVVYEW